MTKPAGVVNRDGPADRAALDALLASSSEDVRALAHAVRDLVFEVLPEAVEVVWLRQRSIGWGTGPRKFSEQFAYLMPFKRHVTLGFYRGGELPDPDGLLPREGGRQASGSLSMRSLKLMTIDEVRRPALRSLIEAATRRDVTPTPE